MARRFNKVFLLAFAMATLVQCSTAQTTHVVGDALGWVVPQNGDAAYTNWAANQTFSVGDILVFNFPTGSHDVAEVTRTSFNACNTASPLSAQTNGPANFTLTTAGEHYYICRFPGHCLGGQKLFVNVSAAASSPAPQPSSPSPPVSAPTPTPTSAPTPTPAPASTPTNSPSSAPTPTSSTATSPSSTPTPTATSPSGVTPPAAPKSSAESLGVAGLFTTFFAVVVALLY